MDVNIHILKHIISLAANFRDNSSKDTCDRRLTLYVWFQQVTCCVDLFFHLQNVIIL